MGSTQAKNIIDNSISSMTSVVNDVVQKCSPTVNISQVISSTQTNCKNAKIHINNVKMRAIGQINLQCAQSAAQSGTVTTQIEQQAKQMAEAISQSLSLNPGSTKAENIMRMSMNVAVAIKNSTEQVIAAAASASQAITNEQSGGETCDILVDFIDMDAMVVNVSKGIQKSEQVATAVSALKQIATQEAIAKQSNMIILLIIAIVIAIGFTGGQAIRPLIYVGVPVLGGTYAWRYYVDRKASLSSPRDAGLRRFKKEQFTACLACA
ncbi:MAG: hypothetical protein KGL39_01510 [Patescibacteria group bacterium]|nr:hypothetical protein [Patescibacteria group bacterium]